LFVTRSFGKVDDLIKPNLAGDMGQGADFESCAVPQRAGSCDGDNPGFGGPPLTLEILKWK
jgi:hypothetical protein